jgi:hypothetical protein
MKTRKMLAILVLALSLVSNGSAQFPLAWEHCDVEIEGERGRPGTASYDYADKVWTIIGSGGAWRLHEAFQFVYRRLRGDGVITARVVYVMNTYPTAFTDPWARAGVMIRETLNCDSPFAMSAMTAGHGAEFRWCEISGDQRDNSLTDGLSVPYWVRIERSGYGFESYFSPDGQNWTRQGGTQIQMPKTVYIGLAVMSQADSELCRAEFDNVTIEGEVSGAAFTYQGRLLDENSPANGLYDLEFKLYDAADVRASTQQRATTTLDDVDVIDGYFTVRLDFGEQVFNGDPRWLEIGIRPGSSTGDYTVVSPRQELTPAVYAMYAETAAVVMGGGNNGGDNLGNHTAAQNINLNGHWLSGDGTNQGIYIDAQGNVGIGTSSPETNAQLHTVADIQEYDAKAVFAEAVWGYGIFGKGANGQGVVGVSCSGRDPRGRGIADKIGVYGDGDDYGVYGISANGAGGYFASENGYAAIFDGKVGIGTSSPRGKLEVVTSNPGGKAVYGRASLSGEETTSYGGYFLAEERNGVGVYAKGGLQGLAAELVGDVVISYGKTTTPVLEITGGADVSEQFEIHGTSSGGDPSPGMVVTIDPDHPGDLIVSTKAYDRKVAGIISGAAGVKPGMLMGQKGTNADGRNPVALTGRVYCWADASYGPIEPGDLLTTSDTAGHAMKVTESNRAQGAILGKAMSSLQLGRGLVLVLVTLQ